MGGKRDKRKKDPAAKAAKAAKQQAKASKVRPSVRWVMLALAYHTTDDAMSASASPDTSTSIQPNRAEGKEGGRRGQGAAGRGH